jgi:thiol-disulfide isomerase/thioredoxin
VGYRNAFDVSLAEIFEGRGKPDEAYPLSEELGRVMTPRVAKKATALAAEADFTLVKYWANWCVPCHTQSRDLAKLFAAYPDVRFALIEVDAGGVRRGP